LNFRYTIPKEKKKKKKAISSTKGMGLLQKQKPVKERAVRLGCV
jgi:hypothetical protein